jgi:hypothetical protein
MIELQRNCIVSIGFMVLARSQSNHTKKLEFPCASRLSKKLPNICSLAINRQASLEDNQETPTSNSSAKER